MMALRDTSEGYGPVTRVLHWSVAVLMIGNFALGLLGEEAEGSGLVYDLHVSLGLATGALVMIWILWRLANPKPEPVSRSPLERGIARGVHMALLLLTLLIVASGVGGVLGEGRPLTFFGIELAAGSSSQGVSGPLGKPSLRGSPFEEDETFEPEYGESQSSAFWGEAHELLSQPLFLLLLALHLAGVLKHHFVDRERPLARMLGRPRGTAS